MAKDDALFDQVLGDDDNTNDGFSEDGDLDLDKIKLGRKTENDDDSDDNDDDSDNDDQNDNDQNDNDNDDSKDDSDDEDSDEDENSDDDEDSKDDEDSDDDSKKSDDKKKSDAISEDDDGFGITEDDIKDVEVPDNKISYSAIANELADVVLFDEKDEEITKEVFINKVKSAIENASKTLDKTKYDPTIVRIIEHIENEGDIADFYQNKTIKQVDDFLAKDTEDQLRIVLTNELRSSVAKDDLAETVDNKIEEMTEKEQEAKLNSIKAQLNKAKKIEFEKITQASQEFKIQKEREKEAQAKKERDTLISQVDKMTNFLGLPIAEKTKKFIKNEIMNGNFDKVLDEDVANVKIDAYFYKKFGDKILNNFESRMTEEAKKSFRKGTEKQKEVKHNIKKKGSSASSTKGTTGKGFKGLKNILPQDEY